MGAEREVETGEGRHPRVGEQPDGAGAVDPVRGELLDEVGPASRRLLRERDSGPE